MPFFVYGRHRVSGEIAKRFYSEAETEPDARRHAEAHGIDVMAVVACTTQQKPPLAQTGLAGGRRSAASPATAADDPAAFRQALADFTPRAYATYVLIGGNVLVFALMALSGVDLFQPKIADLLHWGAEFGPDTTGGQPWRLFTALFVHIGIFHLVYNMLAFAYVGVTVERMLGSAGFVILYVTAGLGGNLLALYWNPMIAHAGASGAIFGVYGALLALLLLQRDSIPPQVLAGLKRFVLIFVAYNLINSLRPEVSFSAHAGGLIAGFVCGLLLARPLNAEALQQRRIRNLAAAAFGAVLLVGGAIGAQLRFPNLDRLQRIFARSDAILLNITPAFEAARAKGGRHELTASELADAMEHDILKDWRDARAQLEAVQPTPAPLRGDLDAIRDYMRRREDSWIALIDALRSGDDARTKKAEEQVRDVNRLGATIARTARVHLPAS